MDQLTDGWTDGRTDIANYSRVHVTKNSEFSPYALLYVRGPSSSINDMHTFAHTHIQHYFNFAA